ncbi:MAG TPA: hypothetical protein VI282_11950 [Verrucomicrobiae bacterium]|jgi:hypothetical protein
MKMRSDCVLSSLTQDQLNDLFESLSGGLGFREVQRRCALPPPEGLGIRVQLATLSRFFKAERRRRHAEELAQARFDDLADDNPEKLLQNVKVELAHACYDLADNTDTSSIGALSRMTHRLDLIRLEQQRLALEREFLAEKKRQFNFNAAREAAKHAAKIHKIIETKGPDNEEKIWMVNDIVFGPPPALPENSNPTPQNENSISQ